MNSMMVAILLTLVCLGMVFRPKTAHRDYSFDTERRFLWIIPILIVWLGYFAWLAFSR